jgi:hypothetical protein
MHDAKIEAETLWLDAQQDNAVSSAQKKIIGNLTSLLGKRCHIKRGKVCPATAKLLLRSVGSTMELTLVLNSGAIMKHLSKPCLRMIAAFRLGQYDEGR